MKVTTDGCLFGAWVAKEIKHSKFKIQNALDIGCGTGLLSLMLAQKNDCAIDAVEIDKDAAAQAMENIGASPWNNRINVFHADVLQFDIGKQYDCIISNPPFYETELRSGKAPRNVAHHDDGLKLSELLLFIQKNLAENGVFYLLLPAKREAELEGLLRLPHFHLQQMVYVRQTTAHSSFRLMIKSGHKEAQVAVEEISIKNYDQYTPDFVTLLKDYYLHL